MNLLVTRLRRAATVTSAGMSVLLIEAPWPGFTASGDVRPTLIASTSQVNAPTIYPAGEATTAPEPIASTVQVGMPTVTPVDSAPITPALIVSTAQVGDPTVAGASGSAISPALITSTAAIGAPTLSASVVSTVAPAIIASTAFVGTPAITVSVVAPTVPNVFWATDNDSDIDDVVANALVFALHRKGECNLIGVSVESNNDYAPHSMRVMLDHVGLTSIPVGFIAVADAVSAYTKGVAQMGLPVILSAAYPSAVSVMRQALANAPNRSVYFVGGGTTTSFAALLQSPPDAISPLTGMELVTAKVVSYHPMGGRFPTGTQSESNISKDLTSAQYVAANTPVPVVWSDYNVGDPVNTRISTVGGANDPYLVGWNLYGSTGRQSWDSMPILDVLRGPQYFNYSAFGDVAFANANPFSTWTANANGKHRYITRKVTNTALADVINGLIDELLLDYRKPVVTTPSTATVTNGATDGGTLTADEPVTWSKSGPDAGLFTLDATTGAWSLTTAASIATRFAYSVVWRATNAKGRIGTQHFILTNSAYTPAAHFTTEFGYALDPNDLTKIWQDDAATTAGAVGAPVGRLTDVVAGRQFLQAVAASRPVLAELAGGKVVKTDGTDDFLKLNQAGLFAAKGATIIIAGQYNVLKTYSVLFAEGMSTNNGVYYVPGTSTGMSTIGKRVWIGSAGVAGADDFQSLNGSLFTQKFQMLVIRDSGSEIEISFEGQAPEAVIPYARASDAAFIAPNQTSLGALVRTSTTSYNGFSLGRAFAIGRRLQGQELLAAMNWVGAPYGRKIAPLQL
jgi:hypothetical protein